MRYRIAAAILILLGTAQMAGDLLKIPALRGLAAATTASPAPKVFSAVRGLETFTSDFWIVFEGPAGRRRVRITSEMNARVRGPYNRRNVFGAVLAFGPVLSSEPRTRGMFEAVSRYALCAPAVPLVEMGIAPAPGERVVHVEVVPRAGIEPPSLPMTWSPECSG